MAETTANQVEELRELFGAPVTLKIGKQELRLLPFEFEQLPDVLEAAAPFINDLVEGKLDRLQLFKKHREAVLSLVAILSRLPHYEVRKLAAFDGLRLFTACIEVNADFFSQGLPEIRKLMNLVPVRSELIAPTPTSDVPSEAASAGAGVDRSQSDAGSGSPGS